MDNDRTRNMKVARSLKSCLRRDDQGRLTSGLAGLPIANIFHTNVILQARPISFFSTHDLTSYITLGWTEEITVICISGLGWGAVGGCGEKHTALLNDFHVTFKQIYMQGASKKVPFRIYHGRDQSALGQIIIFTCSSRWYPLSPGWLASWDGRVEIMI